VGLLAEGGDVLTALEQSLLSEAQGFDPKTFTSMPKWQEILRIRKAKMIRGEFRKFDEERGAPFIMMR
jgi:hypothetical protein